jgi:hypothetical protein
MDGLLFDPIEYIDTDIAADVLKDLTCRQCDHRIRYRQGSKIFSYCGAKYSGRTSIKLLKVKACQPACILFTYKDNEP